MRLVPPATPAVPPYTAWKASDNRSTIIGGATASRLLVNQRLYVVPFWVPNTCTLSALGVNVTSGGDAGRSVSDGVTDGTTGTVTSATAAFVATDVGRSITGTNIPANSYIVTRNSATSVTLNNVTTGAGTAITFTISGALIRLGIYNDSADLPASLLVDALTVSGVSVTAPTVSCTSQLLGRRWYWGAVCAQGVTTTAPTVSGTGNATPVIAPGSLSSALTGATTGYFQASVVTALPDPFVVSASNTTASAPTLGFTINTVP